MNIKSVILPSLAFSLTFLANGQTGSAPTKVGTINFENAIIGTKDGQKAAGELQTRFEPKRKELEQRRVDIDQLQTQLRNGANTMSEDQKRSLYRDIDQKTRSLKNDTEDAQAEWDQERGKVLQDLGQRIVAMIDKYSRDNGFAVILDVSNPQTPVLYASNTVDITQVIIKLYDQASAGGTLPSLPTAPVRRPAASGPAGRK